MPDSLALDPRDRGGPQTPVPVARARLLLHLVKPDAGELVFDGDAVGVPDGIAVGALRRQVQMVFQDSYTSLTPRTPVRDSVAFGPFVQGEKKDEARRIARDMLGKVGLDPELF